jgi:prephenate dehydrogenase
MAARPLRLRILVQGTGLIGTSVALAARSAGAQVFLDDVDPERLAVALSLGAGEPWRRDTATGAEPAAPGLDLAVVAAPPAVVGRLAVDLLQAGDASVVTHVCSVQAAPEAEVEASGVPLGRYVGSHPIAGRELSGPAFAQPDLFVDRPWVICPGAQTSAEAVATLRALVDACGAAPVVMGASEHDDAMAALSHVPQLVASALAASLRGLGADEVRLAGAGLRDTTRLADSPAQLWGDIAAANGEPIAGRLRELGERLIEVAEAIRRDPHTARGVVHDLIEAGRAGRRMLPGKHGGLAVTRTEVQVVIPDQPGALADLLAAVAGEQINLEDLRVEHAPGHPAGVAQLVVDPAAADQLIDALRRRGWTAAPGPATAG